MGTCRPSGGTRLWRTTPCSPQRWPRSSATRHALLLRMLCCAVLSAVVVWAWGERACAWVGECEVYFVCTQIYAGLREGFQDEVFDAPAPLAKGTLDRESVLKVNLQIRQSPEASRCNATPPAGLDRRRSSPAPAPPPPTAVLTLRADRHSAARAGRAGRGGGDAEGWILHQDGGAPCGGDLRRRASVYAQGGRARQPLGACPRHPTLPRLPCPALRRERSRGLRRH